MLTRRRFLHTTALTGAGLVLPWQVIRRARASTEAELLDAASHPKFVYALPRPTRIDVQAGARLNVAMRQTQQFLGLEDDDGQRLLTTVWGYKFPGQRPSYPGATIVAQRDTPLEVRWLNQITNQPFPAAHLVPVDTTVHLANPEVMPNKGIPMVTHLHGGHTESASDGLPEAWFTSNWRETGPHFVKRTYHYDNDQEAATLWYHDHALGITRLNVYAGLAGFYLLRDQHEDALISGGYLPGGAFEIELAVQDRMFTEDGQLFLPHEDPEIDAQPLLDLGLEPQPRREAQPSIIAEFFGDFILVNGMAWPQLAVTPDRYRFRLLNGSDSRFYILKLQNEAGTTTFDFSVIGGDQGFLASPVVPQLPDSTPGLLIGPGERYDLVVDFGQFADGEQVFLRNFGPDEPFKGFPVEPEDIADPATTGQVMRFDVSGAALDSAPNWPLLTSGVVALRAEPFVVDGPVSRTRQLFLFEGLDEFGRLQPILGTAQEGSLGWFEAITERPRLGDVEIWEVFNTTEDAHPIHLHLVTFELLGRQAIQYELADRLQPQHDGSYGVGKDVLRAEAVGPARGPEAPEQTPKDTAVMPPGEVTRLKVRFDRPGRYVWHCHILSHEDHEMMRPYVVE